MIDGADVVWRPRRVDRVVPLIAAVVVGVGIVVGPSFAWAATSAVVMVGVVIAARSVGRRGVWATSDDLLIGNATRLVRVPKAGASTVIERVPGSAYGVRPRVSEGARNNPMHLFVVPGHPQDARVQVEAGFGLTPKRLLSLAAAIVRS